MPERPSFIPNSYQTPNDYADRFMHLLTGDEWKVLSYTVRRTFGFGKYDDPSDRISLSQYQQGKRRADGQFLDHGTGLSRPTIIKILALLTRVRLLTRIAPNDAQHNEGDCYKLQLDDEKVDYGALESRAAEKRETNSRRTAKARSLSPKHSGGKSHLSDSGKSDLPPQEPQSSKSDLPLPVSGTDRTRYVGLTDNKQEKSRGKPEHTHTARSAPTSVDARGGGERVCVKTSRHDSATRFAHANRNNLRGGWLYESRDGRYDESIDLDLMRLKSAKSTTVNAAVCPDCEGKNVVFTDPTDPSTCRPCKHPRLASARAAPT